MSSLAPGESARKSPSSLGILHFPDALERYGDMTYGIYARSSSYSSEQKQSREDQVRDVYQEGKKRHPDESRLRFVVRCVELGKLSGKRKGLTEAVRKAKDNGAFLVARDLSRYVRAERYNRRNKADPTVGELEGLLAIADGVPLATLFDPDLPYSVIHSLISKAGQKKPPGRRSSIDPETAVRILNAWRWEELSLDALAARFKRGRQSIFRLTQAWGEYENPARAYREAQRLAAGQLVEP